LWSSLIITLIGMMVPFPSFCWTRIFDESKTPFWIKLLPDESTNSNTMFSGGVKQSSSVQLSKIALIDIQNKPKNLLFTLYLFIFFWLYCSFLLPIHKRSLLVCIYLTKM